MFSFLKKRNTDPTARLKEVLGEYSLPSFSATTMETMQRLRDPDSSASSIAEVLGADPGLSVQVLRMANSAGFAPTKTIENVTHAIALLGISQLESLVLSAAVGGAMPRDAAPGYDFSGFWHVSALRGVLARSLAEKICPSRASECFTAALLEDMAIPFLAQQMPAEYGPILDQWNSGGGGLTALEREAFPWDHAEVATWIAWEWELPENIASAIGGHHGTAGEDYDSPAPVQLVSCIKASDDEAGQARLAQLAQEQHGLGEDEVAAIIESSFDTARELAGATG